MINIFSSEWGVLSDILVKIIPAIIFEVVILVLFIPRIIRNKDISERTKIVYVILLCLAPPVGVLLMAWKNHQTVQKRYTDTVRRKAES
jgi:hypothetical protein